MKDRETPEAYQPWNRLSLVAGIMAFILIVYFGAPVLLIAPIFIVTGEDPPDALMFLFLPLVLVADKVPLYEDYIEWQCNVVDTYFEWFDF